MFEHRNLSNNLFFHVLLDFDKTLKIDLFERCISENIPIAYDGNAYETYQPRIAH